MATDIKLPALSESVSEGGVLELKIKPGATVKESDIIAVIEAEKSTVEVPAGVAGTITEVLVKQGDVVKTGQVLARVDAKAAAGAKPAAKAPPQGQEAKRDV